MKISTTSLLALISVIFCMQILSEYAASAETVKMGYFEMKPHMYLTKESSIPAGASIEFTKTVLTKMGYDIEWVGPLPLPRLIKYLQDGEVDGSQMININDERQQFLYFPKNPYYHIQSVFAVKKDFPLHAITSIDDLAGLKIGFLAGAHISPFIRNNLDKLQVEYIATENGIRQNLLKMQKGRLQAIYDLNQVSILAEAKDMNMMNDLKILPLPEPPGSIFVVFSKQSPRGKKLVEQYEAAMQELQLNYDDFIAKELQ